MRPQLNFLALVPWPNARVATRTDSGKCSWFIFLDRVAVVAGGRKLENTAEYFNEFNFVLCSSTNSPLVLIL